MAGCIMETTPNILILSPLLLPLAKSIGMHNIHFCIFMVTSLVIGFITPPLGLNLLVVSGLTGEPITRIAVSSIQFVLAMLVTLLVIAFFEKISLWAL